MAAEREGILAARFPVMARNSDILGAQCTHGLPPLGRASRRG
jgi:hypothetical protein